jgi:hypothetical protein
LENDKSLNSDHSLVELIKAEGETLQSEIQKLSKSTWSKEELPHQRKDSTIVPI